jgi:O-antigen/teichoic acid export membrane protein
MIQRFYKDLFIYALPMFLARAVGLLLLPIYTRHLGPVDFGFIEFVAASSAILLLVLPLEINQAVGRLIPEADSNQNQYKIFTSAFWFTVAVFLGFGTLIYLSRFQLLDILNLSPTYAQYALLICIHFLVLALVNLLQVKFRFTSQAKSSVAINLSVVMSNFILVIYFSSLSNLGIEQYFLSQILAGLIGISVGIVMLTKQYKTPPLLKYIDITVLKKLLKYSMPLVVSSVGIALATSIDRIMIGSNVGLKELGYYGAALRLSAIVALGFYVISSAMTPAVYRDHLKPETKLLIAGIFQTTCFITIILLAVITFYSVAIIDLFAGEQFSTASKYLFYLTLSAVISGLYIFFLGMDIQKNTTLLSKINLSVGATVTILTCLSVPLYGVWGAVFSNLIGSIFRLSGYVYFSQKLYFVPFKFALLLSLICFLIVINAAKNI